MSRATRPARPPHSRDIDLHRPAAGDIDETVRALVCAASLDLGDHLRFSLRKKTQPSSRKASTHDDNYGWDVKYGSHALQLAFQGQELVRDGYRALRPT